MNYIKEIFENEPLTGKETLTLSFSYKKDVKITRIIFNNPAVIIIWDDKTKTVVKAHDGDEYDKRRGINYCIAKKFLTNKDYHSYVEIMDILNDDSLRELIDVYEKVDENE